METNENTKTNETYENIRHAKKKTTFILRRMRKIGHVEGNEWTPFFAPMRTRSILVKSWLSSISLTLTLTLTLSLTLTLALTLSLTLNLILILTLTLTRNPNPN